MSSVCRTWACSPGPILIPTGALELIVPEHAVKHVKQQRVDRSLVEGPGLGEQRVDPLRRVPLERVPAGVGRLEHPAQVRARGLDASPSDIMPDTTT